jgi:hypothetical protein
MSWYVEMVRIVRGLINDFGSPPAYSDERIQELLCVSAVLVLNEIEFPVSYTVNLFTFTITPSPGIDFQALVSLKTACSLSRGEYLTVARQAISIKDGPSTIDNKDVAKHLAGVADTACAAYEKARINYMFGDGSLGRAIVGPYGIGMGNSATYR